MSPSPTDKVVVVTGASRGLGLEWVRQYVAQQGTYVVAVVRSTPPALAELAKGGRVGVVQCDITKFDTLKAAADEISKLTGGRVDVLINNAGGWQGAGMDVRNDVSLSTPAEWLETYALNVVAPLFFTQALVPLLDAGKTKHVVYISSFLGSPAFARATGGSQGYVSYSVAKAALNYAALKNHYQFKDRGYTVITLNPGYVKTDATGGPASEAPLSSEESVSRCRAFVDRLTPAESGGDYSLDGSTEPLVS